jgi:hypothetical protein
MCVNKREKKNQKNLKTKKQKTKTKKQKNKKQKTKKVMMDIQILTLKRIPGDYKKIQRITGPCISHTR